MPSPEELSKDLENKFFENEKACSTILSVGIAVVLPQNKILRVHESIPSKWDIPEGRELNEDDLDLYCQQGWVDLRISNTPNGLNACSDER